MFFFSSYIFSDISFLTPQSVSIWKFTYIFVWNMALPVHSLCRFCFSERIPQFTAMCAQPGYGWAKWSGHRVVLRVCIGLLLSFFIINCREVGQTSKADNYPEFCLLFCLFAFQKKRWVWLWVFSGPLRGHAEGGKCIWMGVFVCLVKSCSLSTFRDWYSHGDFNSAI